MKKSMEENFKKLESRIYYSLFNTDLEKINYELSKIDSPTLISGVGGSSVVATYASKVLSAKNEIITRPIEARDLNYLKYKKYNNILSCSYSGKNLGVKISFLNELKHYLLSTNPSDIKDVINLIYKIDEPEKSFISLSATMIPCALLLNYYLNYYEFSKEYIFDEYLEEEHFDFDINSCIYEIFSGYDTKTAEKFLESTMVESGIGIPIVHDKYSYCHGRSTLSTKFDSTAIYFDTNTTLDKVLLSEIKKYYKEVVVIKVAPTIIGDFIALFKSLYLCKYIASKKNVDLSDVKYSPMVKKLYKYDKNM